MEKSIPMPPPHAAKKPSFIGKWGVMFVLSLALAIIVIDTTLLNVSLGAIIRDLGTTVKELQWVITGYALVITAFTITGGRLGDLFGRKKMFILGAVLFALGSFMASISHSIGMLVAGEAIVEGIGAALMMPATSSLLLATFQGKDRAIAFGMWGGIAAASSAIGPLLGGYLTTHFSWRWGFLINVVVAAALIVGAIILIKESRDKEEAASLDWLGVFFSSTGLLAIVYGIIESSTYGWLKAKEVFAIGNWSLDLNGVSVVPVAMALGIILLAVFALWEKRREQAGKTPLVSMSLFKNGQFTSGTVTGAIMTLGQTGIFFTLPVFLQTVSGLDAFHTGLTLLPMSLAILVVAPLASRLGGRIYPKHIIQIGLVTSIAAIGLLYSALSVSATAWDLAPGLILYGIGMGMVFSQISNITLSAVSVNQAGEASGVNNTLRQLGSSLGAAIMGAVLLSVLATKVASGINDSTVIPEALKPQLAAALPSQASEVEFGGHANLPANLSPEVGQEILAISRRATTQGNKEVFVYSIVFFALGVLASFKLPKADLHKPQSVAVKPAGH